MAGALRNLGDCLRLPGRGDETAFVDLVFPDTPRSLTLTALNAEIAAAARGLIARGVRVGDRIAILAANRLENVVSYLAVMRMGAVAAPINYKLTPSVISYILEDLGCRFAIVDAERRGLAEGLDEVVDIDADDATGFKAMLDPGPFNAFAPRQDDLAEILYTSGSTGAPKGVPLTHAGQCWALEQYLEPLDAETPARTTLIVAPLYHMNALFFTTVALANRIKIISLPRFEPETYLKTVAERQCNYLTGVPSMLALAARVKNRPAPEDLRHVTHVHLGSAPLTQSLISQIKDLFPNARVTNGYGSTEAGPTLFGPHPDGMEQPSASIGYPLSSIEWRFANGSHDEGPLEIKSPAQTAGYLHRPEATAKKFVDGWYKTDDIMRRDENGFFYFVGRTDDMFTCGGENIYPGEVETLLERHPAVAQAAVVGAPDDVKGAVPVAFVVLKSDHDATEDTLKAYALENGPAYAHPRAIAFRDRLPVNGAQKIDKNSLSKDAATYLTHRREQRTS